MSQVPTASVNVRFDAEQVAVLDEYATYLGRKRFNRTTRSDVLRFALSRMPVPNDAHPELKAAMEAIGVRPDGGAAPRAANPQPKGQK